MNRLKVIFALALCSWWPETGAEEFIPAPTSAIPASQAAADSSAPPGDAEGEETDTTEQVYLNRRSAQIRFRLEPPGATHSIFGSGPSKNFDQMIRHQKTLERRAKSGDGGAAFHLGLIAYELGSTLRGLDNTFGGDKEYLKAADYYKQACAADAISGCWNVAVMYADGSGVTKSGLAATEWFYRAGMGYIKYGDRERALAALESIQKIDKAHPLGKKLNVLLQKGAPK